jgi:hypothetical protein
LNLHNKIGEDIIAEAFIGVVPPLESPHQHHFPPQIHLETTQIINSINKTPKTNIIKVKEKPNPLIGAANKVKKMQSFTFYLFQFC